MISYGSNIKSASDPLGKVPVKNFYDALRNPKPHIQTLLGQLRVVRNLNPTSYTQIKARLPYIVCAMFNPAVRRTENFAYTQYFIVDIDHISSRNLVLDNLRQKIETDPRTLLCFTSPGGDGLKVMMKLSERCYDAGLYKTFYKVFVMHYSVQYSLQQVVDTRTCDVARACFVSADKQAYYNPEPELVDMKTYINPVDNPVRAFDVKHEADKAAKEGDKLIKKEHKAEPQDDILDKIKLTLDPHLKEKPKKPAAYVPDELNEIMCDMLRHIEGKGIAVTETIGIQYGKKLRCHIGVKQAEVNVFYGKRGYSVVQSPRTGTDVEANVVLADVVREFLVLKGYVV